MAPTAAAARPEICATPRWRTLFVGGSLNQTTMVHRIARELADHERVFTTYYADGFLRLGAEAGLLGFTISAGGPRR